jgi:hypothetical protein
MDAAARKLPRPGRPGQIGRPRHFGRVERQTDTVQKARCGGSQGMEPMHRPSLLDSIGMAHRCGDRR